MLKRAVILIAALAGFQAAPGGQPLGGPPPRALVIGHVTLIDGTGRAAIPNASALVQGNRIAAVSPQDVQTPPGARVIDGTNKFLIPGLMDVHVHLRGAMGGRSDQPVTEEQEREGIRALHSY